MLTTFEQFKTFYNALIQKIKGSRGNWNQNDPTADNYIKGRTHYSESKEKEIFSNNSFYASLYGEYFNPKELLIEGQTYIVKWDGQIYECIARNDGGGNIYIGNQLVSGGWEFPINIISNEPFFIYTYNDEYYTNAYIYSNSDGNYNITIQTPVEVVHKLDSKYLPDDLPKLVDGMIDSSQLPDMSYVSYSTSQELTEDEQYQARINIRAISIDEVPKISNVTETENGLMLSKDKVKVDSIMLSNTDILVSNIQMLDQVNGKTYVVQMRNGNLVSTYLPTISITTNPTKMVYYDGEYLDTTDMVLTMTYEDGSTKEITEGFVSNNMLSMDNTAAIIEYTENGLTSSTTLNVTVNEFDPAIVLVDFYYINNGNGTYTITGWKQTLNGVASTECIIPNNNRIIL